MTLSLHSSSCKLGSWRLHLVWHADVVFQDFHDRCSTPERALDSTDNIRGLWICTKPVFGCFKEPCFDFGQLGRGQLSSMRSEVYVLTYKVLNRMAEVLQRLWSSREVALPHRVPELDLQAFGLTDI